MVKRPNQKLKQILKINVTDDTPHWDSYVNLAAMMQTITWAPLKKVHSDWSFFRTGFSQRTKVHL